MSMLWIVWELFVNFVEEGMFCYLLIKTLGYKKSKVLRIYIGLPLLVIFTTIINITISNTNITILLLLVAAIIFSTVCFESNFSSRFFGGCAAAIIGIIANTIVFSATSLFTTYDLNSLLISSPIRIQMTLLYLVVCSIFYLASIQIKAKNKIMLPPLFIIVLFMLLSLGIMASDKLITFSISMFNSGYFKSEQFRVLSYIGGIYLLVLLGCAIIFEVLGVFYQKNTDLSMNLQEAKLMQNHFENIESSMNTLREWKHDYHHHLQAMQVLLENKKYFELHDYMTQLNTDFMDLTSMVTTGNSILDAIISSKILIAKSYGIAIKHSIFFPENISISCTDLCILLGNLLDNAIESCNKPNLLEPPYINITIKKHKKMFYIKIVNSSNGEYLYENGVLTSTKTQSGHGYGCKKIYQFIEDHGGFCNFAPLKNSFAATVMIPLPDEEEIS